MAINIPQASRRIGHVSLDLLLEAVASVLDCLDSHLIRSLTGRRSFPYRALGGRMQMRLPDARFYTAWTARPISSIPAKAGMTKSR